MGLPQTTPTPGSQMPDLSGPNALYLSDVSPSDKPWDTHRANAGVVEKLYKGSEDYQTYADRIGQCSRILGFALEAKDEGELRFRLQQTKFCRVRHCPVCQWRRSLMWRARFFQAVPRIREAYPTARWVFLTLTVKNCPLEELRATLKEMNDGWKRLTQRAGWPALGFVRSTEVTRSESGEAHPHFHALLLVPASYFSTGYIKQETWRELWQSAMRLDYLPVVNVKAVKPRKDAAEGTDAVAIAVLETLKYGVKESDLMQDAVWLHELTKQLHKTRAISVGGVLKGLFQEDEPEDLIHTETEDDSVITESNINVWFGWREMVKRYTKQERC
jgi:plasmid rolling circle replication initiator protein Rep